MTHPIMPWPVEYLMVTPDGCLWAYGHGEWLQVECSDGEGAAQHQRACALAMAPAEGNA